MTGLNIKKDHLIEIAVLITDGDLNVVAKVYYKLIREKSEYLIFII
jgi:oligoribonuclease